MSAPPTFTPEQIAYMDKRYGKAAIHAEVKRILDTGLMFTEEADMQMSGEHPAFKPATERSLGVPPTSSTTQPQNQPTAQTLKIETNFPVDLQEVLRFTQKGNICIIKPVTFLHGDSFPRTAEIVKGLGGKYVSAGRESHFEVPLP